MVQKTKQIQHVKKTLTIDYKTRQFSSKYLKIILQWCATNDNAMSTWYLE